MSLVDRSFWSFWTADIPRVVCAGPLQPTRGWQYGFRMKIFTISLAMLLLAAVACGTSTDAASEPETQPGNTAAPADLAPIELSAVSLDVNRELQPALESALKVALEIREATTESEDGSTNVMIAYAADPALDEDCSAFLAEVVTDFGGTVDDSFLGCGETSLSFTGAVISGHSVDGTLHLTDLLRAELQVSDAE